jgi:hypothetical protein
MGHAKSTLVDQGLRTHDAVRDRSVAKNVTGRALGVKPQVRLIEGGQRDVRHPLDEPTPESPKCVASA